MDKLPRKLHNVPKLQEELKSRSEAHWNIRGKKMAIRLFHDMAERVPAYKDFLKKNNFDPSSVKGIRDFHKIPVIDKENYLRQYSRRELCWDGDFKNQRWVISTTSGSTGEPFYFPRTDLQDEYYALTAELYLRENFQIQDKSTLYIDAFAMGAWIGGLFTYEAVKQVAEKGYNLSIITPGINKAEVINSVRKLGKDFDQVIIGCYPPLLRDIIHFGITEGLDWGEYNLGIVFSAEGFSEEFRDYIVKHAKLPNPYTSTLNHYGTVDLGTMSHETAASVLIRKQAVEHLELYQAIFGRVRKQPTLTQYLPELFYFEDINGNVLCSSNAGLPLVRYDLKDHGGVVGLREVEKVYRKQGKNLRQELKKQGIENTLWNLPFVYVYERSDFSVTFLGAQIYPEEVKKALLDDNIASQVTGKFTMEVTRNRRMESQLRINIELQPGIARSGALNQQLKKIITTTLLAENSEYASSYASAKKQAKPLIALWTHGHELYFSGKGKQKWVKKEP